LLPRERSRQQFATDPRDQLVAEPGDEAAGQPEEVVAAGGDAEGEAAGRAAAGEVIGGDEAAPGSMDVAVDEPTGDTGSELGRCSDPCTEIVGPQRGICGKYLENHSTNFEPSLGKHQYAPVVKKKTWTASHRVRKKMCASTIPRHRAAIWVNTSPINPKTSKAAATTPVHNPRRGSGWTGGSKNCGAGGCGLNATAAPQD